jgi:hypothetical protein
VRISGFAPAILRANRSIYWVRSALVVTPAARPCRNEFRLDLLLPAAERGRCCAARYDDWRQFAGHWQWLRPPLTAISSRYWRVRELRHRLPARRLRITVVLTRSYIHRANAMSRDSSNCEGLARFQQLTIGIEQSTGW